MVTEKHCTRCDETKPSTQFGKRIRSLDGLQAWCTACMRVVNAARYAAKHDEMIAKNRAYHDANREKYAAQWAEKPKHGLTPAQKREHLDRIGWACETCLAPFAAPKDAHVDHDHDCCPGGNNSCGKCIRGFLCGSCNRALGMVGDDRHVLHALILYLDRYTDAQP